MGKSSINGEVSAKNHRNSWGDFLAIFEFPQWASNQQYRSVAHHEYRQELRYCRWKSHSGYQQEGFLRSSVAGPNAALM